MGIEAGADRSRVVMDAAAVEKAVARMAGEILQRDPDVASLMILGIQKGGVGLAGRIAGEVRAAAGRPVRCGTLDVSFHRDDLGKRLPKPEATDLPGSVTGATVVLVDSVLFSGRTVRAAFDALHQYGRPARIRLAVLVDRGHRELPISPDYVGMVVETEKEQKVRVRDDYVKVIDP